MLIGEPLIYLQQYIPYTICPALEQTYLHRLFMYSTAHARYICKLQGWE